MTHRDDAGRISLDPIALWASALVVVAMAALYWHFSGPIFADWIGYRQLWDNDGGWLLREGRDPLFVSLLHQSRRLFGENGYGEFRFALFAIFTAVGARLAYLMRAGWVSVFFVVPIIISAFMLKSLVQIREGLAFLIVVLSLISVFRPKGGGWFIAGIGAIAGTLTHAGAGIFVLAWAVACGFYFGPARLLGSKGVRDALLLVGVALGVAVTAAIFQFSQFLEFSLQDIGTDTTVDATGGIWKYLYWLFNGLLMLLTRHQLLSAAWGSRKFSYSYATVLGSLIIPLIYTTCIMLVFSNFYLPIITASATRLLFSTMEIGLIIIGLRGKANWMTLPIALALVADQFRLLIIERI